MALWRDIVWPGASEARWNASPPAIFKGPVLSHIHLKPACGSSIATLKGQMASELNDIPDGTALAEHWATTQPVVPNAFGRRVVNHVLHGNPGFCQCQTTRNDIPPIGHMAHKLAPPVATLDERETLECAPPKGRAHILLMRICIQIYTCTYTYVHIYKFCIFHIRGRGQAGGLKANSSFPVVQRPP